MLIKVTRPSEKSFAVYECDRYFINFRDGKDFITLEENDGNSITLEMMGDNGTCVYVMNNDGKTIDSYWF